MDYKHTNPFIEQSPLYRAIGMAGGKRCTMTRCWQDTARTIPANIGDPVAAVDWDDGEPFLFAVHGAEPIFLALDGCGNRYVEVTGDKCLVSYDADLMRAAKVLPMWRVGRALAPNEVEQVEALYALCWFFSAEPPR